MKILVTGGAGQIGSHIAEAYLAAGHEVTILDDLSTGSAENVPDDAELDIVDISDPAMGVRSMFNLDGFDVVNHHAAFVSVPASVANPARCAEVNVLGTLHLLKAAQDAGVKRFVFASTGGAIYGDAPVPTPETALACPASPYGASKAAAESFVGQFGRAGMETVCLRYSNVYGPRKDAGVIPTFLGAVAAGTPITFNGDGSQTRDFVHVSDVVAANVAALTCDPGVYNIGTGREVTIRELADIITDIAGKAEFPAVVTDANPAEVMRSVLDCSRALEAFGWRAEMTLEDGLRALSPGATPAP